MAEAIFAVLREGLSLSQAARKYDIPYPTFVLYANRVHNMLGPSADGSSNTGNSLNSMSAQFTLFIIISSIRVFTPTLQIEIIFQTLSQILKLSN